MSTRHILPLIALLALFAVSSAFDRVLPNPNFDMTDPDCTNYQKVLSNSQLNLQTSQRYVKSMQDLIELLEEGKKLCHAEGVWGSVTNFLEESVGSLFQNKNSKNKLRRGKPVSSLADVKQNFVVLKSMFSLQANDFEQTIMKKIDAFEIALNSGDQEVICNLVKDDAQENINHLSYLVDQMNQKYVTTSLPNLIQKAQGMQSSCQGKKITEKAQQLIEADSKNDTEAIQQTIKNIQDTEEIMVTGLSLIDFGKRDLVKKYFPDGIMKVLLHSKGGGEFNLAFQDDENDDIKEQNYQLSAHRTMVHDIRNDYSTFTIIHKPGWASHSFNILANSDNESFKIQMATDEYSEEGWYLSAFREEGFDMRSDSSTRVCLHSERPEARNWKLIPVNGGSTFHIVFAGKEYGQSGWVMTAHRETEDDKRNNQSTYIFIEKDDHLSGPGHTWSIKPIGRKYY